jgi:hypothetical protein
MMQNYISQNSFFTATKLHQLKHNKVQTKLHEGGAQIRHGDGSVTTYHVEEE